MPAKLLTPDEIKKIGSVRGRKLELNARVYLDQLLDHIKALTPEKPEKPADGDKA